ncbi:MAG TPA: hypothetical protein VGK20_01270 [Candidatus Binatia bacterium]
MKSVADTMRRELDAEVARMSPEQRVELALRLGQEAIDTLASASGISRDEAREIFRRNNQIGRRPSKSAGYDG